MTLHRGAPRLKLRYPVSPLLPTSEDAWTWAGKPMPILYEDDGQEEMGEANLHTETSGIFHVAIKAHMRPHAQFQVYANLNCYYSSTDPGAYVSPDVMIVEPFERLPESLTSYRIGTHGPAPKLAIEILSKRSGQQRDLTDKPVIYGQLGVTEYILADITSRFLPERLLLMRRRRSGTWLVTQDPDSGVTSKLGFRIVIAADHKFRVVDAATGTGYLRPDEAQEVEAERRKAEKDRVKAEKARVKEASARKQAEERVRQLEAELAHLRKQSPRS